MKPTFTEFNSLPEKRCFIYAMMIKKKVRQLLNLPYFTSNYYFYLVEMTA